MQACCCTLSKQTVLPACGTRPVTSMHGSLRSPARRCPPPSNEPSGRIVFPAEPFIARIPPLGKAVRTLILATRILAQLDQSAEVPQIRGRLRLLPPQLRFPGNVRERATVRARTIDEFQRANTPSASPNLIARPGKSCPWKTSGGIHCRVLNRTRGRRLRPPRCWDQQENLLERKEVWPE